MQLTAKGLYEYKLESVDSVFRATLSVERESEGIEIVRVKIEADAPAVPPIFNLKFSHPVIDVQGVWHPNALYQKSIRADWIPLLDSKSTSSAPVVSLFGGKGVNRLTFAFSDVLNVIKYDAGLHEETSDFNCIVAMFDTPTPELASYEAELRIDIREIPYYTCLGDVSKWWSEYESNKPSRVPAEALEPMYSTWYSFHQELTPEAIEEQCRLALSIGCKSVIVDDGWQTADNARGYAFCGDWQVCEEKMIDMKAHVGRVHAMGLKYLLWYSVPFIGVNSEAWTRFQNKLLYKMDHLGAGVVDPRYPEVREYLISIYEKALLDWDLDGFKLDFVDVFQQQEQENESADPGRDIASVPQAVDVLLSDVMSRLRAIKPDIMIEFRQPYISPLMRKYGNLFRAGDCPNDAVQNRIRTLDIRLLCGDTAAHADMIMWNPNEPVDSAALQLINILFAVPQISVRLETLPQKHLDMLTFWLSFWREHRDVLMHGQLQPQHPEQLFPLVTARNHDRSITAVYNDCVVSIDAAATQKIVVVNGTRGDRLIVETAKPIGARKVRILDCMGVAVSGFEIDGEQSLLSLSVPPSGLVILESV
ncbi:glycoside hydrolase family 36 protein [Paenibacillus sp. FJAT-27812]|uniref:glycoside hydrolase family 36 protein n=1 Tax=Paenibacillus sp. FJAT-27812 TaxID=1684143 RepID=UPI0006A79FD5|nr:glycoside hydrolase family 36 protein [Paenibacillus sp. FJAT-27812]